ncbi:MAG: ribulose-phosphate 3-epimerase, partial [Gammaproteobacteria bacterium]|nr:ribulose-phosphate 3-epimerase [Gammaproteobacteria bacterium]
MKKIEISASILSADFARLGEEVDKVIEAGADRIHIDVMDNHYVPNLTVGPLVCQALKHHGVKVPLDVHLMIQPVDALIPAFAQAGATRITFHPEASLHVERTLQLIRDCGCEAGLALNPATPLSCLDYVLDQLSVILVMSVNPGFGGQHFLPSALKKIKQIRHLISTHRQTVCLEVDGGVKADNVRMIVEAGADTLCVGSAIFGAHDYHQALTKLRESLTALPS